MEQLHLPFFFYFPLLTPLNGSWIKNQSPLNGSWIKNQSPLNDDKKPKSLLDCYIEKTHVKEIVWRETKVSYIFKETV